MSLSNVLNPDLVILDMQATNKREAIEELLDTLMSTGKVSSREDALACVLDREAKISTGIQFGIAIPHGKCTTINTLVACIGLKKAGLDFESLDGEPSRIFFMTLSPVDETGPHIELLAEISNILKTEEVREELVKADSVDQVLEILSGY